MVYEGNREAVIGLLSELQYEFEEVDGTIVASKYCETKPSECMCIMVECPPPFNMFKEWSRLKADAINIEVERLVGTLNQTLSMRSKF